MKGELGPLMDLSSYALSQLRAGDLPLYRGVANGVASALILITENSSPEYLSRLEHEYALSATLMRLALSHI
jgi:hypothetical protein